MIFGDAVRLLLLLMMSGGSRSPAPTPTGPAVPTGAFPSAKPDDLPPWPQGWCPELPPAPEVQARAWALLPTLWAKGENTRTLEMTGGRWIWYVATTVDGQKAVAAYRSVDCDHVAPVAPSPAAPAPPPAPAGAPVDAGLIAAANTMNAALRVRGYKRSDMIHYQDFQKRAGLAADGYPGTVTMLKLETILKGQGQTLAPVKIYPWKAGGAYDGVNAPTAAEWEGGAIPASSPIAPKPAPAPAPAPAAAAPSIVIPPFVPPLVAPPPSIVIPPALAPILTAAAAAAPAIIPPIVPAVTPSAVAPLWTVKTNTDVQRALNAIGYGPLTEDGIIGPQSKAAILAYQKEHPPLAQDSIAGPLTMAALTVSIAKNEHRPGGPSPGVTIPILSPTAVFNTAPPAPAPAAPVITTNVQIQHALNLLGYKGVDQKPLTEDGKIGPNSVYAIKAFQKEHPPLAVDGVAGTQTKAALSTALARATAAAA